MRLLKPCKVKRFLATAALSEVGLVTAPSDPEGKREDRTDRQTDRQTEGRRLQEEIIEEEGGQSFEEGRTRGTEKCRYLCVLTHLFLKALVKKRSWHQGLGAPIFSPLPSLRSSGLS